MIVCAVSGGPPPVRFSVCTKFRAASGGVWLSIPTSASSMNRSPWVMALETRSISAVTPGVATDERTTGMMLPACWKDLSSWSITQPWAGMVGSDESRRTTWTAPSPMAASLRGPTSSRTLKLLK